MIDFLDSPDDLGQYLDYDELGAHCVIICYNITQQQSHESVGEWVETIQMISKGGSVIPIALIGIKADFSEGSWVRPLKIQQAVEQYGA